jgi:hypothetical protein
MNSSVAEASTCTMKYFKEASVLHIFLTLDITGINDIRLTSRPIHAHPPSYWLRLFSSQTFSRINTPTFLKPSSFYTHLPAYEDGTDRVLRNVGI